MPSWPALRGQVGAFGRRQGVPCSSRSSKSEILAKISENVRKVIYERGSGGRIYSTYTMRIRTLAFGIRERMERYEIRTPNLFVICVRDADLTGRRVRMNFTVPTWNGHLIALLDVKEIFALGDGPSEEAWQETNDLVAEAQQWLKSMKASVGQEGHAGLTPIFAMAPGGSDGNSVVVELPQPELELATDARLDPGRVELVLSCVSQSKEFLDWWKAPPPSSTQRARPWGCRRPQIGRWPRAVAGRK